MKRKDLLPLPTYLCGGGSVGSGVDGDDHNSDGDDHCDL